MKRRYRFVFVNERRAIGRVYEYDWPVRSFPAIEDVPYPVPTTPPVLTATLERARRSLFGRTNTFTRPERAATIG